MRAWKTDTPSNVSCAVGSAQAKMVVPTSVQLAGNPGTTDRAHPALYCSLCPRQLCRGVSKSDHDPVSVEQALLRSRRRNLGSMPRGSPLIFLDTDDSRASPETHGRQRRLQSLILIRARPIHECSRDHRRDVAALC